MPKADVSSTDIDTEGEEVAVSNSKMLIEESAGTVSAMALVASVLIGNGGSSVRAVMSLLGLSSESSSSSCARRVRGCVGRWDSRADPGRARAGFPTVNRRGFLRWCCRCLDLDKPRDLKVGVGLGSTETGHTSSVAAEPCVMMTLVGQGLAGTVVVPVRLTLPIIIVAGRAEYLIDWQTVSMPDATMVGVGSTLGANFILGRADTKAMLAGRHVVGRQGCLPWR